MLFFALLAVVLGILCIIIYKNAKDEEKKYLERINQLQIDNILIQNTLKETQSQCENTIKQYTTFQESVEKEKELEKDKEKRRRVNKTDREVVLERDDETCQICGISKAFMNSYCKGLGDYLLLEIDHIQPVSKGGTGKNLDNLQCLCWRCNRKKGDKKSNEEVFANINYGIRFLEPSDLKIYSKEK